MDEDVEMLHVLCGTCGMSGTMVRNATAEQAWEDHMVTHEHPERFTAWTWTVQKLPYQQVLCD